MFFLLYIMVRNANDKTLFHLVPINPTTKAVLLHPDNQRFVSPNSQDGSLGLEIGFHVPPYSRGHVIARLGRNTDLILRESFSAVHLAFEMHPETFVVMLSVRTKQMSSVGVVVITGDIEQTLTGDCAIIYGQGYRIRIATYEFGLVWNYHNLGNGNKVDFLRNLAVRGYEDSLERLKNVRSRDLSLPETSTPNSWYMTRLRSSKAPQVTEVAGYRTKIGRGAFGTVFKTMDLVSGNYFAVKEVELGRAGSANVELSRAAIHKEIKILESASHVSCDPPALLGYSLGC